MKVWLMSSRDGKTSKSVKRFLEENKTHELNMKFVAIEDIEIIINSNGNESLYYKNKPIKLPDVVFPRNNFSYQMRVLLDFFENQGIHVLNPMNSMVLARDKFLSLQKMSSVGLPVPKTILFKGTPNIDFIENELNFPVIVKKLNGSQGKGIIKASNRHDLEDILEMLDGNSNNFLLQEFIGEKVGQDVRLFVLGGKVIASMLRTGKEGDFKSNYSGGGSVSAYTPNEQEEMIAMQAVSTVGLDIAGIDLLFDKNNGYRICEINSNPGFEGLELATGRNIAREIMDYIQLRYDNGI